jgi:hypothetical protein
MAAIKVENVQTLTQVSSVLISATKNNKVFSLKTQVNKYPSLLGSRHLQRNQAFVARRLGNLVRRK